MIGYDEQNNKLIILRNAGSQDYDSPGSFTYTYDFKTSNWTLHPNGFMTNIVSQCKTNFSNNSRGELIVYQSTEGNEGFYKWTDFPSDIISNNLRKEFMFMTKDVGFGQPAVRKKVYSVHITYRCSENSGIKVIYGTNGEKGGISGELPNYRKLTKLFTTTDDYTVDGLLSTDGEWKTITLKPDTSSEANNIKSMRLQFYYDDPIKNSDPPPSDFAINDITIVYRLKNLK